MTTIASVDQAKALLGAYGYKSPQRIKASTVIKKDEVPSMPEDVFNALDLADEKYDGTITLANAVKVLDETKRTVAEKRLEAQNAEALPSDAEIERQVGTEVIIGCLALPKGAHNRASYLSSNNLRAVEAPGISQRACGPQKNLVVGYHSPVYNKTIDGRELYRSLSALFNYIPNDKWPGE